MPQKNVISPVIEHAEGFTAILSLVGSSASVVTQGIARSSRALPV
jgi:hypothetical protein